MVCDDIAMYILHLLEAKTCALARLSALPPHQTTLVDHRQRAALRGPNNHIRQEDCFSSRALCRQPHTSLPTDDDCYIDSTTSESNHYLIPVDPCQLDDISRPACFSIKQNFRTINGCLEVARKPTKEPYHRTEADMAKKCSMNLGFKHNFGIKTLLRKFRNLFRRKKEKKERDLKDEKNDTAVPAENCTNVEGAASDASCNAEKRKSRRSSLFFFKDKMRERYEDPYEAYGLQEEPVFDDEDEPSNPAIVRRQTQAKGLEPVRGFGYGFESLVPSMAGKGSQRGLKPPEQKAKRHSFLAIPLPKMF